MRSTADLYCSLASTLLRFKQHSKFIGRGSVGERPSTSTLALGTADERACTFPLLPSGWIVTVRRHALFRHLLRHRGRPVANPLVIAACPSPFGRTAAGGAPGKPQLLRESPRRLRNCTSPVICQSRSRPNFWRP